MKKSYKQKRQNSKIFLTIFALPFLAVGVYMLFSIVFLFSSYINMQSWNSINAYVIDGGYKSSYSDGGTTYKAYGTYRYTYQGKEYTSKQLSIKSGSDNIGDYQQDMGNKMSSYAQSNRIIKVFVNPKKPSDAVIDRNIRWEMVGFYTIFVILFGGFGVGAFIWSKYMPKVKDLELSIYKDKPWLANDDWQDENIFSDTKILMYFLWVFAIFWNSITAFLPFLIYNEVTEKENYAALLGLMFPLIGIGVIVAAIKTTLAWRRFSKYPVMLDPFPGSIGGNVGGTIELNIPYDSNNKFTITLSSTYNYETKGEKNINHKGRVLWQEKVIAHTGIGINGTRISFRFDVPEELNESDATNRSGSYYTWCLNLSAKLNGIDINRDFDIPVYKTAKKSLNISNRVIEFSETATLNMETKAVNAGINLTQGVYGPKLYYPIGRNLGSGIFGVIAGAVFVSIGSFLMISKEVYLIGGAFALVGSLIIIAAFYMSANSLTISKGGNNNIKTARKILGITTRKQEISISDITKLTKKSSFSTYKNNKEIKHYTIYAHNIYGGKIILGEGFKGQGEADTAINIINNIFIGDKSWII